jgi:hypothetical protein
MEAPYYLDSKTFVTLSFMEEFLQENSTISRMRSNYLSLAGFKGSNLILKRQIPDILKKTAHPDYSSAQT